MQLIKPGDPEWKIGPSDSLSFQAGAATARDKFAICAFLEGPDADPFDPVTHLFCYEKGQWALAIIPGAFGAMKAFPDPEMPHDALIIASWEGDVYIIDKSPNQERIVGAGLTSDDSIGLGYIEALSYDEKSYFALGQNAQIYQRGAFNWKRKWPELTEASLLYGDSFSADDILLDGGNVYVSGILRARGKSMETGLFIQQRSTSRWQFASLPAGLPGRLVRWKSRMFCVGSEGVIEFSESGEIVHFTPTPSSDAAHDAVVFRDELYVVTTHRLTKLRPFGLETVVELPGVVAQRVQNLDDNYLWVFGKSIARFDGQEIHFISMPDLPIKQ